jgi:hypothetical protein
MWSRAWSWAFPRLPLLMYAAVYGFTCYVGVIALLISPRFRALYFIFAGADVPDLLWRDLLVIFLLTTVAPLLFWIGYELGVRRIAPLIASRFRAPFSDDGTPPALGRSAFVVSLCIAIWSLIRAGALDHGLAAWFDYNTYVYARFQLLDRLTFFEFVNLYTMLPVWAAYLVLSEKKLVMRLAPVAMVAVAQYALASRKALLTSAIIIASAWYAHTRFGSSPRRRVTARMHVATLFLAPACLYLFYMGLTVQTVIRKDSAAFRTIAALIPEEQVAEARGRAAFRNLRRLASTTSNSFMNRIAVEADLSTQYSEVIKNRTHAVVLYTLLSPFTRTSITAVVYPVVFPEWHPFYPLDLGLDIFRIGTMPDDNVVVYRFLWPMHHRGQVGAPFQVVLYSQGGLWVALAGSAIVGFLVACCWVWIVGLPRPSAAASLVAGLVITFSAFLAIDSVRNSVVVSYGMIWGVLATAIVFFSTYLVGGASRRPAAVSSP